jgi:hypothetical protein
MFLGKIVIVSGIETDFFMKISDRLNGITLYNKKYLPDNYLEATLYVKVLNGEDTPDTLKKEIDEIIKKMKILIFTNGFKIPNLPKVDGLIISDENIYSDYNFIKITEMIYKITYS